MLAYLAPMLTLCSPMLACEMLTPIAVTEKAEVGTGWGEGGEDEVGGRGGTPLMPGILDRMACGVALDLAIGGVSCAAGPPRGKKTVLF